MTAAELAVLTAFKPFILQLFSTEVVPEITKLEGEIGNSAVQKIVTTVTTALENLGQSALAAV